MDMANASIYTSMEGLTALKARASKDAKGSLDEVAKQFESLFVQQMLKSMRQAGLGEGLMDNDQSLFYRDMYDQQLAIHLSESGGMGLADVIKRQLGDAGQDERDNASMSVKSIEDYQRLAMAVRLYQPGASGDSVEVTDPLQAISTDMNQTDPKHWSPDEFVEQLWPWAIEVAGVLGLKPQALVAQAALETGWGKHLIRSADGSPANNLFGIKADQRWDGDRVSVNTLEYDQGTAVKKRAAFRSYASLRDSFHDYADFLQSNPRYDKALQSTADSAAYFTALQRAGYATDPEYANKINAVMNGAEMTRALERLKLQEGRSI
jgi:flagellar protein FlgJ